MPSGPIDHSRLWKILLLLKSDDGVESRRVEDAVQFDRISQFFQVLLQNDNVVPFGALFQNRGGESRNGQDKQNRAKKPYAF